MRLEKKAQQRRLESCFGEPCIVGVFRASRARCAAFVFRKNAEKIPEIVHESLSKGVRPVGRSRASWKDHDHQDMRIMGLEEEDAEDIKVGGGLLVRLKVAVRIKMVMLAAMYMVSKYSYMDAIFKSVEITELNNGENEKSIGV